MFHWKENCKFEYMELSKGKMLNSSLAASLSWGTFIQYMHNTVRERINYFIIYKLQYVKISMVY